MYEDMDMDPYYELEYYKSRLDWFLCEKLKKFEEIKARVEDNKMILNERKR